MSRAPLLTVRGTVRVPGDKSISHRALLLAALADGPSRLRGLLASADVRSTAGALRALGVAVPPLGADVEVRGVGLRGLRSPAAPLDCGNSGTTARLLAGVVAGSPLTATFVGDASLSRRPMRRVARPLSAMGAAVTLTDEGTLPMTVRGGALRPYEHVSEAASAQVKSAVLLAGLVGGVGAAVREPAPSRDHTERMLRARGVAISCEGGRTAIEPVAALPACDVAVPADPSSAAFLAALAALAGDGELRLSDVCLNPTRIGFLRALRAMGADVGFEDVREAEGEPVGTVVARPGALAATRVEAADVPAMVDELPLLACVASRAAGTTEIRGAGELRVKESDRIGAVVANLRAIGVEASELPDGLVVVGGDAPLRGTVRTHGDHRLAMAFGVLGALPASDLEIDDPACVAVSYPGFWADLAAVTA